MIVGVFLLVSPCSGGMPPPPPGPYIPKYPEEDILIVQAYIESNILHLTVTFAAPTPPPSQTVGVWVTRFQGSSEVTIFMVGLFGTAKNPWTFNVPLSDGGSVDIAVYAMLGTTDTDRWPNTGFQRITSTSAAAPNQFRDYDGVGGVVLPTNSFLVLAPYLALIGLVATAGVAVKKRRS